MPELGEVAHAAGLLRRFLLGRTIKAVSASVDDIVYVKPLNNVAFEKALTGHKVTKVGRNGKYFWFEVGGTSTVLLHFGMTGWIHVKDIRTHFQMMESGGAKKQKEKIAELQASGAKIEPIVIEEFATEVWPPRFHKFLLTTDDGREIAFTDPRRLGRIRIIKANSEAAANLEPLSKLGIDFSQDRGDLAHLSALVLKRKVPVKALLLDQSLFSGIGNWMADEILFQARLHPEQYSNTLDEDQVAQLYNKLIEVANITVENEGNSLVFPENWLMLHRWGKGAKKQQQTHAGHKVAFLTVGGRTSCYVPELQKLRRNSAVKEEAADIDSVGVNDAQLVASGNGEKVNPKLAEKRPRLSKTSGKRVKVEKKIGTLKSELPESPPRLRARRSG